MTSKLTTAAIATAIFLGAGSAPVFAAVLDFEFGGKYSKPYDHLEEGKGWKDLELVNGGSKVYGGLEWETNWEVVSDGAINEYYESTPNFPSGSEAVYNGDGDTPMTAKAFDFQKFELGTAEFRAWPWRDDAYTSSATGITITGFLVGAETGSVKLDPLKGDSWQQFSLAGLETMDSFEIAYDDSGSDKWWMMDDLEVKPVPLPSAAWLLVAGLGGLFGTRWLEARRAT